MCVFMYMNTFHVVQFVHFCCDVTRHWKISIEDCFGLETQWHDIAQSAGHGAHIHGESLNNCEWFSPMRSKHTGRFMHEWGKRAKENVQVAKWGGHWNVIAAIAAKLSCAVKNGESFGLIQGVLLTCSYRWPQCADSKSTPYCAYILLMIKRFSIDNLTSDMPFNLSFLFIYHIKEYFRPDLIQFLARKLRWYIIIIRTIKNSPVDKFIRNSSTREIFFNSPLMVLFPH